MRSSRGFLNLPRYRKRSGSLPELGGLIVNMEVAGGAGMTATGDVWKQKISTIIRGYWEYITDIAMSIAVLIVFLITDTIPPRTPFIQTENLYMYSYPFMDQTIQAWVIPIVAVLLPIACFCVSKAIFKTTYKQLYRVVLALMITVLFTAAITNCIKVTVARPRPNFVLRCWPDGVPVWNSANKFGGYPACSTSPDTYLEHLKSFPSGHSSVSAAGLGFLTLFLLGQTKAYVGQGFIWRFLISMIPALGAIIIAVSRVVDYWHHPTDVIAGLLIGFIIAFLVYRLLYPCLTHPRCNVPMFDLNSTDKAGQCLEQTSEGERRPSSLLQRSTNSGPKSDLQAQGPQASNSYAQHSRACEISLLPV